MIQTKIAQILSPKRFVLAAGSEQGVRERMEFIIYELSDPIFDPETQEPLGRLELHKGRITVIHVQEKLSTATTLLRKFYQRGLLENPVIAASLFKGGWVEDYEELPIDKSTATAVKADLTVKIGDLVRSVE
jgi:hypothetical protein